MNSLSYDTEGGYALLFKNIKTMKKIFYLTIIGILLLTSCQSKKNNQESIIVAKFPVVSPTWVDTIYTSEYVAEIQSIQNVEIRSQIKGYLAGVHIDEGRLVRRGHPIRDNIWTYYNTRFICCIFPHF